MNKMREQIAAEFLAALKEDIIPWERGWYLTVTPVNHAGKEYHGINRLWLSLSASGRGFKDNRWMTFNQASEKGYRIKKGETGTKIEFWSLYDTVAKNKVTNEDIRKLNLTDEEIKERFKPISSIYTVFNAEQIEGIPPQKFTDRAQINDRKLQKHTDMILKEMGVKFMEGGDRAYYVPDEDVINLPHQENFINSYVYYATLLHEAAHATGHESRLNRKIKNFFGSPDYAREELRAEISSAFISQSIRLKETGIQNHKAYIQNWIEVLEKNPDELFAAIRDAEKISDYLIEKGRFQEKKYTESKEEFIAEMEEKFAKQIPVSGLDRAIYSQVKLQKYSDTSLEDIAEKVKQEQKMQEPER